MDGWMDEGMDWMDGWMDKGMDWMDGWMKERIGWMDEAMKLSDNIDNSLSFSLHTHTGLGHVWSCLFKSS